MAVNKNAVVKQARAPLIAVHHCYNCCSDGFETLGCLLLTKISMAYPHSKLSKPSQGRALQTVRTLYPHTSMHVHVFCHPVRRQQRSLLVTLRSCHCLHCRHTLP